MVPCSALAVAALLLAIPASATFEYSKTSPVLLVDKKSFNKQVLQSNHTSLVEFFAPWCGHCQNLKPAYEKAAENLKGIANVVAIDCDQDINKEFCGKQGVKGFPTLKTYKPSAKAGAPVVQDYNGPRNAKGMVDWVIERVPNHVTRITASKLDNFLLTKNETAKAILFTTKGTTSPLYKALSVDFLGSVTFAQIRDKEVAAVEKFGVTKFPTLILLPGGEKEGIVFEGDMKKDQLIKFVSQVAEPNKGLPEVKKEKASKAPKAAKSSKESTEESESSASPAEPAAKPKPTFDATIRDIPDLQIFAHMCLSPKSKTCILIITPRQAPSLIPFEATNAYLHSINPSNFPFFQMPQSILTKDVKDALDIEGDEDTLFVRAVNGRRSWYVKYEGDTASVEELKAWADSLRMGEAKKVKMPEQAVGGNAAEEHDEL